jgi:hypothetical protein
MDLKSFREFMWNKRRNEYLRLKYTERYQNDPEPWEAIYKDVSDTAVSGLTESDSEPYEYRARKYTLFIVKRSKSSGELVRTPTRS